MSHIKGCQCDDCREIKTKQEPQPCRPQAVATNRAKYATYVINHILHVLKVLLNLNTPGRPTPFLKLYAKWTAAENDGKTPGHT